MVSNEDILMQFTAQDDVSSVVEAMESSVTSSLEAISSAMDNLDTGLTNLAITAETVATAFGEVETAFDSAESSADSFQSTIDGLNANNISDISSEVDDLSDSFSSAEEEASGLASAIDSIDSGSISDVEGEVDSLGEAFSNASGEASSFGDNVNGQDTSALRTNMLNDIESTSSSIAGLGQTALWAASDAEQGWMRLGNAINNSGGNWETQESNVRSWVKTYSNSMGRGVADTRTAMTTFLNMGMSLEDTQNTMTAVSNYAAQFGMSQADASKNIQMAFMGAGRAVKKLGLDIADFKDAAGNVDREKLLAAIMEKTSGAADKYANTYEARVQRMNNAINSLRTDFGREIINTIEPLIPVVQQVVSAFVSLPQPVKSAVLAFGGLVGGAAIIAGPLLKMRAYMNMAGVSTGTLTTGLKTLLTGFRTLSGGGGIKQAIQAMKDFAAAQKAANAANSMGGLPGIGNTKQIANTTSTVVKDASAVGGLAPEATAAAGGVTATGGALSGISAAFTSMIVPLIAIAAVIAVMIPIIAGLVAEALLFIKGIQILIDALGFDDIDLGKAIEGIKQVGQALLEVGIAMAEMTFASVMTAATVLVNGVTGLINPVKIAGQMLVQAAKELEVFKTVKVDESVATNLQSISKALGAVSNAMSSLTGVVLNMAAGNILTLGGLLGNVNTAIRTARTEITNAAQEIAKIKDLPDIDEAAVSKLEKISSSIESVSKAMDGLRSIRDDYNWDSFMQGIFGGADIQTALNNVKTDIIKAGNALKSYTGLPDIPEDVSSKMQKIADTLKSTAEAMKSLRGIRDDYNWDTGVGALFGGVDIPTAINNAKSDLIKVGNTLKGLSSLPEIPDGIYTKVQRIGTSAKNVGTTLRGMQNMPFPDVIGLVMIPAKIAAAKAVLSGASRELVSLNGTVQTIPDGLYTKVQRVGVNIRAVGSAVQGITAIPFIGPDVGLKIGQAVGAVRTAASQLNRLQGLNAGGGIGQILASVRSAVVQLRATLNSMRGGFRSAGVGIGSSLKAGVRAGMNGLRGVVVSNVTAGMSAGVGPARSGGNRIGSGGKSAFQTSFKISQVASNEVTYATQAIQNGTASFVQAVGSMAEQAVQEAKNKLDQQSPGKIARMWGDEMSFSSMLIENRGKGLISSISKVTSNAVNASNPNFSNMLAFNSPELDASRLDSIRRMNQSSTMGQGQRPIAIHIGEGAIQLDARNLTTTESRQIMINALEGLNDIKKIDV